MNKLIKDSCIIFLIFNIVFIFLIYEYYRFECPNCDWAKFYNVEDLERHLHYKHSSRKSPVINKDNSFETEVTLSNITCFLCKETTFLHLNILDAHFLSVHSNVKSFQCIWCDKYFPHYWKS